MLSFKITIIVLKRAGSTLPLALHLAALDGLGFIFDGFLASYVTPTVKLNPHAFESFPIASKVEEFLQRPEQVLLLAAKPGIGKTSCALWLSRFSEHLGHIWLFISLPSIDKPFAPFGLVDHIQKSFGFDEAEMAELQSRRLVLILDSLDEVASQPCAPTAEPAPGLGPVHIQMPSAWEVKQCTLRLTCNPLPGGRVARVYARQQS